jgi:hypothetical protein
MDFRVECSKLRQGHGAVYSPKTQGSGASAGCHVCECGTDALLVIACVN